MTYAAANAVIANMLQYSASWCLNLSFACFVLQVFQIAAHLVYWGKAIIVYPLCENNVYMLSPHANICL